MLLPSALDVAPCAQVSHTPLKLSTIMRSPPPSRCRSPTSPLSTNIYSACRSLQSLLAMPAPATKATCEQPILGSPISLTSTLRAHTKKLKSQPSQNTGVAQSQSQLQPRPQTPPHNPKKRSRSISDQENNAPSTPKRQRLCPPSLPLGLDRADFEALQEEAATIPLPITPAHHQEPDSTLNRTSEDTCSSPDSNALVSTILDKLRLRRSEWDKSAQKLKVKGNGKDSIGERWKVLLGDGEVGGLRRGSGPRSRGRVQQMEFGGPLMK